MADVVMEIDNSKYGSMVTYHFLEDLKVWEGKAELSQQYQEKDSGEWGFKYDVTIVATEETFNEVVATVNESIISLMQECEGDFRNLEDKTPEISAGEVQ